MYLCTRYTLKMHRYVDYLRRPRSKPLTIRQYNTAQNDLLDENAEFQSACLKAWNVGQAMRNGDPGSALCNAFPEPPALKECVPGSVSAHQLVVVRPKTVDVKVALTPKVKASLRQFADRPDLGVPETIASFVHPTSAAAVSSLLDALDFNLQPVMYT